MDSVRLPLEAIAEDRRPSLMQSFAHDLLTFAKSNSSMSTLAKVLHGTLQKQVSDWPDMEDGFDTKLKIHMCWNKEHHVYALVINAHRDGIMLKLAARYTFPRGCIVFWRPGKFITTRGFYPKFQNDQERSLEDIDWSKINEVCINEKYSGFLIQAAGVEIDGKPFVAVFSKQTSEGLFVERGWGLIKDKMTPELVKVMAEHDLYLGFEGLDPEDNTHGYVAKQRVAVVTCLSQGATASISAGCDKDLVGALAVYRLLEDLVRFCQNYHLSHGMVIQIHGQSYAGGDFKSFLYALVENRDNMSHVQFTGRLIQVAASFPDIVRIIPGNVDHLQAVGDVFEGLVLSALYAPDSGRKQHGMVKIKFTPYTWTTMFLRPMCQGVRVSIEKFADYWCSSAESKRLYISLSKAACAFFVDNRSTANDAHVHLAKIIRSMDRATIQALINKYDGLLSPSHPVTVIFVVGPIGSGKTTFANLLCKSNDRFCHIDGDDVCQHTNRLGVERSDVTFMKLYQCILENKTPVLSTGGGAVATVRDVKSKFTSVFGPDVRLVTCIMGREDACESVVEITPGTYDATPEFTSFTQEFYVTLVKQRQELGVWGPDVKADEIHKRSMNNKQFAQILLAVSDDAFLIGGGALFLDTLIDRIPACMPTSGNLLQKRVVVLRTSDPTATARHFTLSFVPSRMEISRESLQDCIAEIQDMFPDNKIHARLHKFTGVLVHATAKKCKPVEIAMAFFKSSDGKTRHITEFCGRFKPVDMNLVQDVYVNHEKTGSPLTFQIACNNQQKPGDIDMYTFVLVSTEDVEYEILITGAL